MSRDTTFYENEEADCADEIAESQEFYKSVPPLGLEPLNGGWNAPGDSNLRGMDMRVAFKLKNKDKWTPDDYNHLLSVAEAAFHSIGREVARLVRDGLIEKEGLTLFTAGRVSQAAASELEAFIAKTAAEEREREANDPLRQLFEAMVAARGGSAVVVDNDDGLQIAA